MSFRSLLIATSILCGALSAVLLFYPPLIYVLFDVEGHATASFMSRRASMMFLGLAVTAFAVKDLSDLMAQRALSLGLGVMMVALALLGIIELIRGFAGPGILFAIVTELVFAAGFLRLFRQAR